MWFSECSGCSNGFCKGGYIIVVGVTLLSIGRVVVVFLMIDDIYSFGWIVLVVMNVSRVTFMIKKNLCLFFFCFFGSSWGCKNNNHYHHYHNY